MVVVADTDDDTAKIYLHAGPTRDGTWLSIEINDVGWTYGGSPIGHTGLLWRRT